MTGKKGKSVRVSDDVHILIREVQLEASKMGYQMGVSEFASLLIQRGAEEFKKDLEAGAHVIAGEPR